MAQLPRTLNFRDREPLYWALRCRKPSAPERVFVFECRMPHDGTLLDGSECVGRVVARLKQMGLAWDHGELVEKWFEAWANAELAAVRKDDPKRVFASYQAVFVGLQDGSELRLPLDVPIFALTDTVKSQLEARHLDIGEGGDIIRGFVICHTWESIAGETVEWGPTIHDPKEISRLNDRDLPKPSTGGR